MIGRCVTEPTISTEAYGRGQAVAFVALSTRARAGLRCVHNYRYLKRNLSLSRRNQTITEDNSNLQNPRYKQKYVFPCSYLACFVLISIVVACAVCACTRIQLSVRVVVSQSSSEYIWCRPHLLHNMSVILCAVHCPGLFIRRHYYVWDHCNPNPTKRPKHLRVVLLLLLLATLGPDYYVLP